MIQRRRGIHLIVCIWILSLYIDQFQTSYFISSVKELPDAVGLLSLKSIYMVKFISAIFNNAHNPLHLMMSLVGTISLASFLMLILSLEYYRTHRRILFMLVLSGPFIIFVLNLMILVIALIMNNPSKSLIFTSLLSKATMLLSIAGSLITLIYWVYFEGDAVDS